MCLKTKVMFSSNTSAGSGYISTDMIMEFSSLITKTTKKKINEILNSFEANKYVNAFIRNKTISKMYQDLVQKLSMLAHLYFWALVFEKISRNEAGFFFLVFYLSLFFLL